MDLLSKIGLQLIFLSFQKRKYFELTLTSITIPLFFILRKALTINLPNSGEVERARFYLLFRKCAAVLEASFPINLEYPSLSALLSLL